MTGAAGDDPVTGFAAAMARAAPFETEPHLAVALSGGADSTATTLLAREWAAARGGRVTALIVDHGLRPDSAREAAEVHAWCRAREVDCRMLRWTETKPLRAIQERAREARHALLESWCREAGVLHLLLGHHADDQHETIAMRGERRSGADGLAGMPAIAERTHVRLLRPLLGVAGAALRRWLTASGETWIEDPSNSDPRFLRARLRAAGVAGGSAPDRAASDRRRAAWLGRHAAVHPEGWIGLRRTAFLRLPRDEADGVLRAALMTVSGRLHPPRVPALAAASAWAGEAPIGSRRSVHGCLMVVGAESVDVVRDATTCRAVAFAGPEAWFDRRFRVRGTLPEGARPARILALDRTEAMRNLRRTASGILAARALPAVQSLDGSVGLLHVLYGRGSPALVSVDSMDVSFRPIRPLAGAAFAGPETVKLSSTPESPVGAVSAQPRLPERVVPP